MPLGGVGTGTISLAGRGALVDWELRSRPDKGFTPKTQWASTAFWIRTEDADGHVSARLLEGPLDSEVLDGDVGAKVPNHGFPRFRNAAFSAAYPLARVSLSDAGVPVSATLEAMNPLVPGDASASGIPAALLRWCVRNPGREPAAASVAGTVLDRIDGVELALEVAPDVGEVTSTDEVREPGWNVSLDRYWRRFVADGTVGDSDPKEPQKVDVRQRCVAVTLGAGEETDLCYLTEAGGLHHLVCHVPVPAGGTYTLKVHLANTWSDRPGPAAEVTVGGTMKIIDPWAEPNGCKSVRTRRPGRALGRIRMASSRSM